MPVFRLDVQVKVSSDVSSNRYFILAADIPQGLERGLVIANLHRQIVPAAVTIDAIRVSTPAVGDNLFATMPLNLAGLRASSSAQAPPFLKFRVDMQHGYKRPLRKYLAQPLREDFGGDSFLPSVIAYINGNYCAPLVDLEYVVDFQGAVIESASLNPVVGMHQLRRGSKRKTQPII